MKPNIFYLRSSTSLKNTKKSNILSNLSLVRVHLVSTFFKKYGDRFEYIMNDRDPKLIEFYKEVQKTGCKPFFDFANKHWKNCTKELHKELIAKKNDDVFHWFFSKRCYTLYPSQYYPEHKDAKRTYSHEPFNDRDTFVKNCVFHCKNYTEFLKPFEGRKDVLIFLDPPYFQSCNGYYYDVKEKDDKDGFRIDHTTVWIDILNLMKSVTPTMLVSNYTTLIHYIFIAFFVIKYGKVYSLNSGNQILKKLKRKRRTRHCLYHNFKQS